MDERISPVGEGETQTHSRQQALRGMGYMVRASMECPAGGFGQAALIADLCQQSGDEPLVLKDSLLAHEDVLQRIADRGNALHQASERQPYYKLEIYDIIRLALDDFGFAADLMCLGTAQLQFIYQELYKEYREKQLVHCDVESRVKEMIREKQSQDINL